MDINTLNTFFTYILNKNESINLRISACLFLKNYIQDYFYDSSNKAILNKNKIMDENSKAYFKDNVLQLLLNIENKFLPHFIEMIKLIVQNANGYLVIWPKLMNFIGDVLKKHDFSKSKHIYDLLPKIIKRYHIESKSEPLFREIINTMNYICQPMTEDALNIIKIFNNYDPKNVNNENMIQLLQMMNKIMSVFYSLNYQDFPEFFEDHLQDWITILNDTVLLPNKSSNMSLVKDLKQLVLKLKAKTLKNINLYYSNYYEDVEQYVQLFCSSVWTVMCQCKTNDNFSKLMKELLDFFKYGFQMRRMNNLNMEQLNQIIENIILPNMIMSDKESEEFLDNPIEFLKIEFEEYDMSSNKYFSINLLQLIISNFPDVNKQIIGPKINTFLSEYNKDKIKNSNKKLIVINLLFASCIKTFAQRFGVTELNPNSVFNNIESLINEIFIKEFQSYNSPVIIQVYALKFLSTFRLQISDKNKLGQIILMLLEILNNCGEVTQYACLLCLDLIINMKDLQTRKPSTLEIVNNDNIFNKLISSLLNFISKNTNIFAMRCFYRTLKLTQDQKLQSLADSINTSMDTILRLIIKSPQTDEFNYYYFETCALIMKKFLIKNNNNVDLDLVKKFENCLRVDLNSILQNNITDLLGYTFQLFAFYLYISNDNNEFYQKILTTILTNEKMWDINMKYLFPPSIEFIKVILITNKQFCENKEVINLIFKICKILLENKCFNFVFQLLEYLVNYVSSDLYGGNLTQFLKITNGIAIQNMTTNPKVYSDINQEMILLLSKLYLTININLSMEMVKVISNNPIQYLVDMIDEIPNLKNTKSKKTVVFWYVQILNNFHMNIDDNSLVTMTTKLLNVLKNFYGINYRKYYDLNRNEDLSYAANNYNKLNCANIEHQINTYKIAEECEESKIFFTTLSMIFQNKKIDYIKEALKSFKGKEFDRMKSFVQQSGYNIQ
jgi:exportin-2 (importin alpha re-exporter)